MSTKRPNPVRSLLQRTRAEDRRLAVPNPSKLSALAWPGGYTIIYVCGNGDVLCAECATDTLNTDIGTKDSYRSDIPVAYEYYDEGPPIKYDGCGKFLEASYGDPSEEENK